MRLATFYNARKICFHAFDATANPHSCLRLFSTIEIDVISPIIIIHITTNPHYSHIQTNTLIFHVGSPLAQRQWKRIWIAHWSLLLASRRFLNDHSCPTSCPTFPWRGHQR